MKTAISIPDPIFNAADQAAKQLGVSRSEFYAKAIQQYLAQYRQDKVTEKLNEIYRQEDSSLDKTTKEIQFQSLEREEW